MNLLKKCLIFSHKYLNHDNNLHAGFKYNLKEIITTKVCILFFFFFFLAGLGKRE